MHHEHSEHGQSPQAEQGEQGEHRCAMRIGEGELHPLHDMCCYMRACAQREPELAALCCFALGFVLGWKLKPW